MTIFSEDYQARYFSLQLLLLGYRYRLRLRLVYCYAQHMSILQGLQLQKYTLVYVHVNTTLAIMYFLTM